MDHVLSRLLTVSALAVLSGVLSVTACTHTTERVVEPVGGGDASPAPEVSDAGVSPLGPIAHPVELEPKEDFRLVRAPEFGAALVNLSVERQQGGLGGTNAGGATGIGGSDLRPVQVNPIACGGGTSYY